MDERPCLASGVIVPLAIQAYCRHSIRRAVGPGVLTAEPLTQGVQPIQRCEIAPDPFPLVWLQAPGILNGNQERKGPMIALDDDPFARGRPVQDFAESRAQSTRTNLGSHTWP
jgi:hypothetical protein